MDSAIVISSENADGPGEENLQSSRKDIGCPILETKPSCIEDSLQVVPETEGIADDARSIKPSLHDAESVQREITPAKPEVSSPSARRSRSFSSTLSSGSICIATEQELLESSVDFEETEPSVKRSCTGKSSIAQCVAAAAVVTRQQQQQLSRSGRGLHPEGQKQVEGFESCGLWVAKCNKKLPKTQSWCFVPLIFSALGRVPDWLQQDGLSSMEQIEAAQPIWSRLFSHWSIWREELRKTIVAYDVIRFGIDFLPKASGGKSWTTSLVFGEPRTFGKLPHPQGAKQDKILSMLPGDMQNQIFASVLTIASG